MNIAESASEINTLTDHHSVSKFRNRNISAISAIRDSWEQ